jgi:hypothetical protein
MRKNGDRQGTELSEESAFRCRFSAKFITRSSLHRSAGVLQTMQQSSELPGISQPVEKVAGARLWPLIRPQKRHFVAFGVGLCTHKRAWIEFYNRLLPSRQLGE